MHTTDSSTILDVADRKQLLLDQRLVASSDGVRWVMNRPRRTGELLLTNDQPWEGGIKPHIGCYCSVLKEDGVVRLWYDQISKTYRRVLYAESTDGIHFVKPHLGLHEIDGSRLNNVVIPGAIGGCAVWIDPQAPPELRYKCQAKTYPGWPEAPRPTEFHVYGSPDGYRWTLLGKPQIGECDVQNIVLWDARYGRYVMYTRRWVRFEDKHRNYRGVRRMESDDLLHWDHEADIFMADEVDLATYATATGQPAVDYYGAAVYKYPEAGDLYIMLTQPYWHFLERPPEQRWGISGDPQTAVIQRLAPAAIDVRLAWSVDGQVFQHTTDRGAFIGLGPAGCFDSRMLWAAPNPIRMGDELWFYYAGVNLDHDGFTDSAAPGLLSGIGRAVLRLDGFVSADAAYSGGQFTTAPLRFTGRQLELNVDTGAGGCVYVEVLDAAGQAIPGLTRAEAVPVWGNAVRLPVRWRDQSDLSALANQPVRLRFLMQDCKLYAFRFRDA